MRILLKAEMIRYTGKVIELINTHSCLTEKLFNGRNTPTSILYKTMCIHCNMCDNFTLIKPQLLIELAWLISNILGIPLYSRVRINGDSS